MRQRQDKTKVKAPQSQDKTQSRQDKVKIRQRQDKTQSRQDKVKIRQSQDKTKFKTKRRPFQFLDFFRHGGNGLIRVRVGVRVRVRFRVRVRDMTRRSQ